MFESNSRAGVNLEKKKEVEKGGIGNLKLRGKTHSDGSKTPNWEGEELYGMLCDHREVMVTCWDDDVGKDDYIGGVGVDLLEIYKEGVVERWWELKSKNGKKKCGEVRLKFAVKTARGVSNEVEQKFGYPCGWDLRGVGGVKEEIVPAMTIRGYGVKGKAFEKPVPVRRRRMNSMLTGGVSGIGGSVSGVGGSMSGL
jgi:hypothetical protein